MIEKMPVEPQRKIIHIDMDAFYASVEQRDFPEYRGRPVVVGGSPNRRGVVATCSYEARQYGIHSAMPAAQARKLCPRAIFIRPRFEVYRAVSAHIQSIFRDYTSMIEPLSLDEAYLDVTHNRRFKGYAMPVAREIKRRVLNETGLTASAGVSYNKFLAKIASDLQKPDGLYLIRPDQGPEFVRKLPIGRFFGVGKVTEAAMMAQGIHTGEDLLSWSVERLINTFGKHGWFYYQAARAIDERPVVSQRKRKSVSAEKTFDQDLLVRSDIFDALQERAYEVAEELQAKDLGGRTVSIKVKYADFEQITRRTTLDTPVQGYSEIARLIPVLLKRTEAGERPVRLLGVCVSALTEYSNEADQPLLL